MELVWHVDPLDRTVEVYTAPSKRVVLRSSQTLTGGSVLPDFKVMLKQLFVN